MIHQTGIIASRDGTPLFYEHWAPQSGAPWATVVLVQGRGEHTGRYALTAQAFVAAGLSVWAGDVRGQGRSGGRRGHVTSLRDFLQDIQAVMALATGEAPQRRPVLLGHSMGGLLALHYAVEHPLELDRLILSSPLCGLTVPVPVWEDRLACWLSRWWPAFPFQRSTSDAPWLSHQPDIQTTFLNDPLVHFRVTARLFYELKHAMGRLPGLVQQLTVPTLVLQAGDDHIVSVEATRRTFERIGAAEKRLIVYDGFYHELFNEVDAARVIHDAVSWLKAHGQVSEEQVGE